MSDADNQAYYDDFARGYERKRGYGYHELLDAIETSIIAPLARGKKVLEAGCGTGLLLERIVKIADEAEGVDISPGMLEQARARGLDVTEGSVTDLPFEDNTFDLVCCFKVIAHVENVGLAIAEMARVTKPGGHIAVEFYNPLSLRYLAKRVAGPGKISQGRTEADVYTRWDTPWQIRKYLPAGVDLVDLRGVRVFTPIAKVHDVPLVGPVLRRLEWRAVDSPLRHFGGFLVAVLTKQ